MPLLTMAWVETSQESQLLDRPARALLIAG